MKPANDKRRHLDDAPCNAKNKRFHSDDTELLADSNDASGEGNSVKSANNSQMQISDVALKIMVSAFFWVIVKRLLHQDGCLYLKQFSIASRGIYQSYFMHSVEDCHVLVAVEASVYVFDVVS